MKTIRAKIITLVLICTIISIVVKKVGPRHQLDPIFYAEISSVPIVFEDMLDLVVDRVALCKRGDVGIGNVVDVDVVAVVLLPLRVPIDRVGLCNR